MLKLYYDGLCHLCSREISHYRKQKGSDQIEFVDITAPDFAAAAEGLDPKRVHAEMHARRADGSLAVGVDAFIAIWQTLPAFHGLAKFAQYSVPNRLMRMGYHVFAKIRPYLPRKKRDCEASPYCTIDDKPERK